MSGVRARRQRSVTEILLSIVLGLEAALVFFVMVTVFGLRLLPAGIAFSGGIGLMVLLVVTAMLLRFRLGVALGWAMQAVIIAIGLVTPLMYFIGAGFFAIWIYCFVTGRALDARNARRQADQETPPEKETP